MALNEYTKIGCLDCAATIGEECTGESPCAYRERIVQRKRDRMKPLLKATKPEVVRLCDRPTECTAEDYDRE